MLEAIIIGFVPNDVQMKETCSICRNINLFYSS